MSQTEHLRTFLAITPDEPVLDAVQELSANLRRDLDAQGLRWEARDKWHVTIRFLGDVPATDLPDLCAAINTVCQERTAFPARVAGVGAFPSLKRPRVLWAGVESEGEHLTGLHHVLSATSDRFVAKPDEKRFRPHLTLARIRTENRRLLSQIEPRIRPFSTTEFGAWEVRFVELWRSILRPGGSQYELLSRAPLKS